MSNRKRTLNAATLAIVAITTAVLSVTSANAQLITGVTATASTEFPNRTASDIVDGTGLSGATHDNVATGMWLTQCCSTVDPNPFVVFDLGAVYTVNSFQVWNYNEGVPNLTGRGVDDVAIEYGNTLTFGTVGPGFGSTVAGVTNFAQADGTNTYAGENFNTFAPFNAQYIKFDVNSFHGPANDSFGLSEVQFDGVLVGPSVAPVEIAGVSVASVSSEFAGREAVNSVNESGLNILGHHSNAPGTMWLTSGTDASPEIVYDLGGIVDIGDMQVWNYNENSGNPGVFTQSGLDEVEILVSDDNFVSDIRSLGVFDFDQAILGLNDTDFSQLIALDATAQYVKLDILSSFRGAPSASNGFFGLSEVKFFEAVQIAAVPEPASIAIWSLIGLCLTGYGVWQSRKQ